MNEIIETERNYVQHLDMMLRKFRDPLQSRLQIKDLKTIFMNIDVRQSNIEHKYIYIYNVHLTFVL